MFNNAIAQIPEKWALCDGTLGTPDLRDKFIVGAGDTYNPGDKAGAVNHTHPFTSSPHFHDIDEGGDINEGIDIETATAAVAVTGTTDNGDVRPPYHGIVFIKKIKEGGP
ncbi:unnamed protein product [marine sediment metagenome]|uniref:Phage tail collar domain-containing protein n=1 Tax=marine sediment metagenome TaxID=412755 RepID=X1T4S2_9ZZZZ